MPQEGTAGHWPELERLVDGLSKATAGEGRCYGITGPVGIGKTHLLRRLEGTAEGLGFDVLRGSCRPGAGADEVFSMLLTPPADISREQLPLALLDRLVVISSQRPVLMTVDDLHLADPASVPVLVFLARSIVRSRIMIALTCDDEMLETGPGDVGPITDGLRVLVREGLFEELKLQELSRPALESVLGEEFMGPMDPSLAELVWRWSEGNPMVAIEEVRLLVQSRQVEMREGRWGMAGSPELEFPDDYSAFIGSRMDLLSQDDRGLLAVAAVVGRSFDPRMVSIVQRRDLLGVLEQLDRIAHDHKLIEESGDGYRFSVGAARIVLLGDLPAAEVRRIHELVGAALEGGELGDTPFDDLSEHYYQAERTDKCACFSLLAGQRSLKEGDYQSARDHFQKVLDATDGGGFKEERLFCMEGIADAELALGRADRARYWYGALLKEDLPPSVRERVLRKTS